MLLNIGHCSMGGVVTVLGPKELREEIVGMIEDMMGRYVENGKSQNKCGMAY